MHRPRTRRTVPVLATAALLAVSACGGSEEEPEEEEAVLDLSEFRQDTVPQDAPRMTSAQLPDDRPSMGEGIDVRMAWEAAAAAQTAGGTLDSDTTAECPEIETEVGATMECSVSYLGEELTWGMEITEADVLIKYDADLSPVPMVRDHVEDVVRWQSDGEYVQCDMPEVVTAEAGEDPGITCEAWNEYALVIYEALPDAGGMHELVHVDSDYGATAG